MWSRLLTWLRTPPNAEPASNADGAGEVPVRLGAEEARSLQAGHLPFAFFARNARAMRVNVEEPATPDMWDPDEHAPMKTMRVCAIRSILATKGLPPELIREVFIFADEGRELSMTRTEVTTYTFNACVRYLRTPCIFSRMQRNFLYRIEVDIDSHDQGWSQDPNRDWIGTYQGSYTWFELTLDRPLYMKDDVSEGSSSSDASTHSEHGASFEEIHRIFLTHNIHGVHAFKRHTIVLAPDQPIVQDARPGDSYSLWARTQYTGWANTVRYARVSLWLDWDA
ncbi:hypothetical protein MVES1_000293 [Malassezia vespertilionis]|uniref:uncharacterized protein n=1 Tax=Malassezia vespertilionis TaxID=2020962 RepID=UPI0024B27C2F|nr:uncharacterized protein MVES1_000293 [Malassezia vespertilionis]WFD04968.1 hypothetical protein MVES1_000293 [Malassezia vespertilionis]